MSTADTALSISIKMAPGPEHRQEPVAPDKIAEGDRAADAAASVVVAAAAAADVVIDIENVDATSTTGSSNNNNDNSNDDDGGPSVAAAAVLAAEQSSSIEIAPANFAAGAADSISQSSPPSSGADSKQVSIAATASRKRRTPSSRTPPSPSSRESARLGGKKCLYGTRDDLGTFAIRLEGPLSFALSRPISSDGYFCCPGITSESRGNDAPRSISASISPSLGSSLSTKKKSNVIYMYMSS